MNPISRRDFIKASAATAAFASTQFSARAVGANDRIRIGVIGCGGQGAGHVHDLVKRSAEENIEVVAISDVYQRRVSRAKGIARCEGYLDYRQLLDRSDIDAVLIATPDHWHGKISIDAMDS